MSRNAPSPSALTRCHLSQRERQRMSQIQHLLAVSRHWLSLWESWHQAKRR